MSAYFALIAHEIFVTAQTEPIGSCHSCVFSAVIFVHEIGAEMIYFLLEVVKTLLDVFWVSFLAQENSKFVEFIPDVGDLLVDVGGGIVFFLKISDQSNKVASLIMHFVVEISLEIVDGFRIRCSFSISFFLTVLVCFNRFLFLSFGIHRLIELNIFSQILQAFLQLFNSSHDYIVFSLSLSMVFLHNFSVRIDLISQSVHIDVLADEHIINLFDLLLIFIVKFMVVFVKLIWFLSAFIFESVELGLGHESLEGTLYFWEFIIEFIFEVYGWILSWLAWFSGPITSFRAFLVFVLFFFLHFFLLLVVVEHANLYVFKLLVEVLRIFPHLILHSLLFILNLNHSRMMFGVSLPQFLDQQFQFIIAQIQCIDIHVKSFKFFGIVSTLTSINIDVHLHNDVLIFGHIFFVLQNCNWVGIDDTGSSWFLDAFPSQIVAT